MANVKSYSDFNGEIIEIVGNHQGMRNADFAKAFPGVVGKRCDGYSMWVGYAAGSRDPLPITRTITYKAFASKHECGARCYNAQGRTMQCECSCMGKHHGAGRFKCK